jgi:hypothetical protein
MVARAAMNARYDRARKSPTRSNALSSRRRTLRRPIVCRSKPPGYCGSCELEVEPPTFTGQPGDTQTFGITIRCDVEPTSKSFTLTVQGAWAPAANAPICAANNTVNWTLIAPAQTGLYVLLFEAVNEHNCRLEAVVSAHCI